MILLLLRLVLCAFMVLPAPVWAANVVWASSSGNHSVTCANATSVGTSAAPGSDPGVYATIGKGATCLNAGDVLNIKCDGNYTGGNHQIGNSQIFPSGTDDTHRTIIQGDPSCGTKPQINIPNWFTTDESSGTHRNYFTVQDVSVSGSGGSDGGGCEIGIEGAFILVQRVTITNSYNMNICSFSGTSASANNHDHIIQYSSLQNAGSGDGCGYGIYSNASKVKFRFNQVFGGKCGGAQIYADDFAVDDSEVQGNYFHDIAKATQANVLNLCFGVAVNGANARVWNNIIDGAGCAGGGAGDGISAGYRATNVLLAYNNIIVNWNGYGINHGLFVTTSGSEAKNNIILNNVSGSIGNASANGSSITTATNKTTGVLTDYIVSSSDFHQKPGSTTIDAGTTVAIVLDDYYGVSRPQGGTYDIGVGELPVSTRTMGLSGVVKPSGSIQFH